MNGMTQISRDAVLRLAQLSSLTLTDDEIEDLQADLQNILTYIDQLKELDTSGVEPTYQVTGLENVWREDVAKASQVSREDLLALAPEQQDNQIKVPKVL
jgi:aspartyl-tRNA(Asn)/glutamyl-tRNA(Gln) amidotransferase subunit C